MRILHFITTAALMAAFVVSCSKSSVSQPQATTPANAAEAAAFMTNTLEVLQARYQKDGIKLSDSLANLRLLTVSTNATQQQFRDIQAHLEQLIAFHTLLAINIQAKMLDAQSQAQGT